MPSDVAPGESRPWSWDPSLYAGSAPHYALGRVAYPAAVANELAAALRLDRSGVLLDLGCGPGSLTLLLAPLFATTVGVDADADMLAEAARIAARDRIGNVSWRHLRAEELPADVPPVDVVSLAQSFHWMDRPRVARTLRTMLNPGGALVHVSADTIEGVGVGTDHPHPEPPRAAIGELVARYLGPDRRAGRGVVPGDLPGNEDAIYRAAGFTGPERIQIPGRVVERTTEEVIASVYSLSSSTPHLLGPELDRFDAELRELLGTAGPEGAFTQRMRPITLDIWR